MANKTQSICLTCSQRQVVRIDNLGNCYAICHHLNASAGGTKWDERNVTQICSCKKYKKVRNKE